MSSLEVRGNHDGTTPRHQESPMTTESLGTLGGFAGINVIASEFAPPPRRPSPGEDARRIVRHGLADVLRWLGEDVGPEPGELIHTSFVVDLAPFRLGLHSAMAVMAHPRSVVAITGI